MPNIFFTADPHFNHERIIEFCKRPYANVTEMNEDLIARWNAKVPAKDSIVYLLGDFGFGPVKQLHQIRSRLHGKIIFIFGSHDRLTVFGTKEYLKVINPGGQLITLCHYPLREWPHQYHGGWHLFGHVHGRLPSLGKSLDVGVDCWNYAPVSLEEITAAMAKLT